MRFIISLFTITIMLLLASMFGTVNAVEIHKNGFGGITPLNTTGLTVFNDSLKRSFDYESDSLVLSAEFSILETNGDIRDFSLFDNDLTLQYASPSSAPEFVDSTFRTALETINQDLVTINETSTADVVADEDNPATNYGSSAVIPVRSWTVGDQRSFVQWDISSIPSTAIIIDAMMYIWKQSDSGTFPRTHEAQAVSASWVEGDLTWNTQPAVTGSSVDISITTADTWFGWDITTIVQNWIDGTWTNNGIRIKDSVEGSGGIIVATYQSREGTPNDPSLNITYSIGSQWVNASHSESLDMENTNVSLVWWGQTFNPGSGQMAGKGCSSSNYVYGLQVQSDNTISALVADNACSTDLIQTSMPSGGIEPNRTYGIGVVFEDNPWGTDVHFWLDGEWLYNETSTERVGDDGSSFYVGRSVNTDPLSFLNGSHDEILVFKERLSNDTMKLLTTKQHDIVIRSGPRTTTQGFEGLFFALPWLIVFALIGWIFYLIAISWKEVFD